MRRFALLTLAVALAGVAASCGGDDGAKAPGTTAIVITIPGRSTTTGAAGPASSVPASTEPGATTTGVKADGFATASVTIRRADGTICELCTYVARTTGEHQRGLMAVTDLDGKDGMIFVFDPAETVGFWMKNTVMPLSAAFFGPDGAFLGRYDMPPCPADEPNCPSYGPNAPTAHVLEVPMGDLERLGISDGAVLTGVGDPCPLADA